MNTYQLRFDATRITVKAKDEDQAFHLVQRKDANFKKNEITKKWHYHFDEEYNEEVICEQIAESPGIIQWESH